MTGLKKFEAVAVFIGLAACAVAAPRVLPRTLVVSQSQMYPLRESLGGYLGRYVDQPLCVDPDLPPEAPYGTRIGQADFERQQREILGYGADGFAFFSGRKGAIAAGATSSVSNAVTLRVISAWGKIEDDLEAFREAAENPRGCSHGGRNVILGYWTQYHNTPEQLAAKLAAVRAAIGDKFLYVAEINYDRALLNRRGRTAEADVALQEAFRENCRRYLRVADGIYVSEVILMRQPDAATLCWRHDAELYRTLVRIAGETLDEPEFRGRKMLAVSVVNGHENAYTRGYTTPHDGTRTLRETMRTAVEANADIIKLSEWDEWNENTCFRPTLCNSYSTRRIVRHFIHGLRGEPPAPLPGDDTSVPNLVVTHRKCLSPGEMLYVEVLNVPDGSPRTDIFCTVALTDEHGTVVRTFPEVQLDSGRLEEKRLTVDSAALSPARALNVCLDWRTSDGRRGSVEEGFHPIDLAPGNAWNHKAVKQPLRDLARMTRTTVALADNGISADVACADPIRYVMACGNGDILRIHGRPGTADRFVEDASTAVFMLSGTKWQPISRRLDFFRTAHCAVPGVPEAEWRLGAGVTSQTGTTYQINWIGPYAEPLFLRVPKAKLADARLVVDLPRTIAGEIPLSAAFAQGAYSIGEAGGVQVTAARLDRQAFYPSPLDAQCCAFSDAFVPNSRSTVYFLQVVTMSGKTWRSRPFVREEADGTFASFRVPSVADGAQDVVLPAVRVPCLEYDFSPVAGCVMRVRNGDRRWFGMSGGPFVQSLLRNRGPSTVDVIDYGKSPDYASRAVDSHPRRERQPDGSWAFVFDGVDDYVGFPWETIPQFGSWRLSFEIRPDRTDRREVVYAARFTESNGSLWGVFNDCGRLLAGYAGFPGRTEWVSVLSPVMLSTNAWNSVEIVYDGKRFSVSVNGAPPVFKDCLLPGKSTSTAILGGFPSRDAFFKGRIRRLKVDHALKRGLSAGSAMVAPKALPTGPAAKDGFREVITEDSFTMLNIIPSSPGREDVAAADAKEFAARTGNPYCLYSLTLHPQGRPAMKTVDAGVASYRKWAKLLEGSAVRPAILLQAIVGHWTADLSEKDVEPWQRAINWKGAVTRYCPLDPQYQAYIRETARKLAECRPALILSDDDVRAFSPLAECTCPLHVAEYNRRTGGKLTPEELRALIAKADRKSAAHVAFAELQRDTVKGICRLIREGIDSVDPAIPSGVCEPGWAWARRYIADYARAMSGPNHTAWARLANGQYYESAPKETMGTLVLRTMASVERLRGSGLLLLDEADTWPHNLWSKSAVAFHAKLSASAFIGLKGAKLWLVNAHKGRYPVSRHYTEVLERHRGFYPALSAAVRGTTPTGVLIPCHTDYPCHSVAVNGSRDTFDPNGWAQKIFSWYGIPYRATEDFTCEGIYALGGAECVRNSSDADLRAMLAKKALVDGIAARELIARGFGPLIGVALRTDKPLFTGDYSEMSGDFLPLPPSSNPPLFEALPGAKTLSSAIWRESSMSRAFERVAPSGTLFRNSLGGLVAVTAFHLELKQSYLYSEARQRYVYGLLDALEGKVMANVCANAQNVLALSRRAQDGADLLLLENLNYDPEEEVLIRRADKPASVEEMSPDGTWKPLQFAFGAGVVSIPCPWPCYGVKVFRIR